MFGAQRGVQGHRVISRDTEWFPGTQSSVQRHKGVCRDTKESARTLRGFQGHRDEGAQRSLEGHRRTCLSDTRRSLEFHVQTFLAAGASQPFPQPVADVDAGAVPVGDLCCAGHTPATRWHGQLICMAATQLELTRA